MNGFDPKCLELAEYFFPNATKTAQRELAQRVQDEVEFWATEIEEEADSDSGPDTLASVGMSQAYFWAPGD